MKISSNCPSYELYFKHIILEVFPSDFLEANTDTPFELNLTKDNDKVTAFVSFKKLRGCDSQLLSEHHSENISCTCAIGRALIEVAGHLGFGIPPYGVLTGVRPLKIASEIYDVSQGDDFSSRLYDKYLISKDKCDLLFDALTFDRKVRACHQKNDLSLYFSIPFCPTRCNYCSFVSSSIEKKRHLIPSYLETLFGEMRLVSNIIDKHSLNLKSVYVGGGTPGILNEDEITLFFKEFNKFFSNKSLVEFTFEIGRPETVTKEKLMILKSNSVNRISINTQTTNNDVLKAIGRNHTVDDYFSAVELAKSVGFKCINTDIIAGLQGESLDSFKSTLKDVISLNVDNVTVHTLCVKKSSEIKLSNSSIKSFENINDYINFSKEYCITSGFLPYYLYRQKYSLGNHESTGYCKNGLYSHYNISMMNEIESVIGLGAGATTRIVSECGDKHKHFENYKYPNEYINDKDKMISEINEMDEVLSQN